MRPITADVVTGEWENRQVQFRSDEIIVGFHGGIDVEGTLHSLTRKTQHELSVDSIETELRPHKRWTVLRFGVIPNAGERIPALARLLARELGVRYAYPNFVGHGHATATDGYGQQWWVTKIRLPEAWDITTGSSGVLIAVIDSGIPITSGAATHPDLRLRALTFGPNYVMTGTDPNDDHVTGHGTHVAGIVAADTNNGVGVAGANWNSPVYIAKVIDKDDLVDLDNAATAIEELVTYVTTAGIMRVVVNVSFGDIPDNDLLKDALAGAYNNKNDPALPEFLICCACEPITTSTDGIDWPAAYAADSPHLMAVGCVNNTDKIDSPLLMNSDPTIDAYRSITIFAPGVGILSTLPTALGSYGTDSGTSMAAPIVCGVASLVWSANDRLSAAQVRQLLVDTGVEIGSGAFSRRRVDARAAVEAAIMFAELESSPIHFVDVPTGESQAKQVVLITESTFDLTFEVVAGSEKLGAGFILTARTATFVAGSGTNRATGIEVQCTGGAPGDVSFGEFVVTCRESGQNLTVYLVANTAETSRTAVVLIADRSGSMGTASGIYGMTRLDVLRESAKILVDSLRVGDAFGVVGFDTNASLVAPVTDITGAATTSAERDALKTAIGTLAAGGATSIGDGVALGNTKVAPASQENHALIVLTDGHENAELSIADVMGSVTVPTYAIGMGTASVIQPASLSALTSETEAYMVLTDALDDSDRYRVAKYFLQVLAAAWQSDPIVDPHGRLLPAQTVEIPFNVAREDHRLEAFAIVTNHSSVVVELRTPDGTRVEADALPLGVHLAVGEHVRCFRASLPMKVAGKLHQQGMWRMVLSMPSVSRERFVADWRERRAPGSRLGIPYAAIVTVRSDIRMRCRVDQARVEPGAIVTCSARVTDRGLPTRWECKAFVEVRSGAVQRTIKLQRSPQGVYEGSFVADRAGVYTCRFRASGKTRLGDVFTREQTITAHAWQPLVQDRVRSRSREIERRPD